MSNINDYINWRGDLSFVRDPVNMIDCLLLAQLSYMRWELIWQPGMMTTLANLFPRFDEKEFSITFTAKYDRIMLPLAAKSRRFGSVLLSDFVYCFDEAAEEQFSAVTFHLPDNSLFIAFRGTDCTLVGWREDFKIACKPEVPAQAHAAEYLAMIAGRYKGRIRIAGHSKGGNLAVYAAATASQAIQDRLLDVCNFDGPGQQPSLFASPGYQRISRLHTLVPVSSIIGMLLCHPEKLDIVKSDASSIYQHNPYSWQLCGTSFLTAENRNSDSHYFEKVFEDWLKEISLDERTSFVDTVFDVLASTKARTFGSDLFQNLIQHPKEFLSSISNVNKDSWQNVIKVIRTLASSAVEKGFSMSPAVALPKPEDSSFIDE